MRAAYLCAYGPGVGSGHLARGVALLEQKTWAGSVLIVRGDVVAARCWADAHAARNLPVESSGDLFTSSSRFEIAFVDDYEVSEAVIKELAESTLTVLVDDWMRTDTTANVILNVNLGAEPTDYIVHPAQEAICGARYVLIRKQVWNAKSRLEVARGVLLTLGGSDPQGHSARVFEMLMRRTVAGQREPLTVVLGADYSGPNPWRSVSKVHPVYVVTNPSNFLELCGSANLVICGASNTSYEMSFLKVPFIPVSFVDNQRRVCRAWEEQGVGSGVDLESHDGLARLAEHVCILLADAERREQLRARVGRIIDGRGGIRLTRRLASLLATH